MTGSALRAVVELQGSRKKDVAADQGDDGWDGNVLPVHTDDDPALGDTVRIVSSPHGSEIEVLVLLLSRELKVRLRGLPGALLAVSWRLWLGTLIGCGLPMIDKLTKHVRA